MARGCTSGIGQAGTSSDCGRIRVGPAFRSWVIPRPISAEGRRTSTRSVPVQPPGLLVGEEVEDLARREPPLHRGPEVRRQQVTVGAEKGASKPVSGDQERGELFGKHVVL